MAITAALLVGDSSGTNGTSYTTASITPTANRLVLAAITNGNNSGSAAQVIPTLSGNGLTWVEVGTVQSANAVAGARLTVFRAMGATPSAGAVTIDLSAGGITQTRCGWSIVEFDGIDTSGTNGSGAVVQFKTAAATSGTAGTADFDNPFTDPTNNGTYSAIATRIAEAIAEEAGFTELHDLPVGGGDQAHLETMWRIGEDQTPVPTWASSAQWAQLVIEIAAAVTGATGTIAVTQAADVGALTGTVLNPITGTIASTQAANTMAATGQETFAGTIAATQAPDVGALSGTVANPITGTIGATQADQTGALVGSLNISGTIGATQQDDTAAFAGTVANPITGTIGATQDDDTADFQGAAVSDGTWNSTQDDNTGAFTGTVANPVTGTIGATQADQTGAFTGTNTPPAVTGTIGATQDDQTGSFTGIAAFGVVGVLGAVQDDDVAALAGTVVPPAVTGVIAANQDPNVGAFTGLAAVGVVGTIAANQDPNTGTFVGFATSPALPIPGTVTCTLSAPTASCVLTAPSAACTISPVNVIAGTNVVITTTFHDADGNLADPTTVEALVQHPDGTTSAPTPTSSSVGIWTTVVPTDDAGFWFYQITGAGNDLDVVCTGSFCAQPSLVLV